MEPAWIGVIGTGIGALAGGIPALGTAIVQSLSARAQRKHDAAEAAAKREADAAEAKARRDHEETVRRQQIATDMFQHRRATIADWREQLRVARNAYQYWEENRGRPEPNIVGDEWFEELRAYLSPDSAYVARQEVNCDMRTVTALSIEIGRIEQEWTREAQG